MLTAERCKNRLIASSPGPVSNDGKSKNAFVSTFTGIAILIVVVAFTALILICRRRYACICERLVALFWRAVKALCVIHASAIVRKLTSEVLRHHA